MKTREDILLEMIEKQTTLIYRLQQAVESIRVDAECLAGGRDLKTCDGYYSELECLRHEYMCLQK